MSTTQTIHETATGTFAPATVDLKLEVVNLPVSDVDRAKRFYEGLGWRLDGEFTNGPNWRAVQMTPPGSPCSIHFGKGITTATPGSVKNLYLVVSDIVAARTELLARGAEVSEPFHFTSIGGAPVPGLDPERHTYMTYASFSDPDGNTWLLQEVTTRLPGRGLSSFDAETLTELLRETEEHHGEYEPIGPKHHWSVWYAAYMVARQQGKTPEEAAKDGARQVEAHR
ncbi:MAG TPA: VOC family protein [Vicinamibacterales bacterium]|jgi:catechol 2,3-dioxygenase-like lactoylglutathione lyase family enzyme